MERQQPPSRTVLAARARYVTSASTSSVSISPTWNDSRMRKVDSRGCGESGSDMCPVQMPSATLRPRRAMDQERSSPNSKNHCRRRFADVSRSPKLLDVLSPAALITEATSQMSRTPPVDAGKRRSIGPLFSPGEFKLYPPAQRSASPFRASTYRVLSGSDLDRDQDACSEGVVTDVGETDGGRTLGREVRTAPEAHPDYKHAPEPHLKDVDESKLVKGLLGKVVRQRHRPIPGKGRRTL